MLWIRVFIHNIVIIANKMHPVYGSKKKNPIMVIIAEWGILYRVRINLLLVSIKLISILAVNRMMIIKKKKYTQN